MPLIKLDSNGQEITHTLLCPRKWLTEKNHPSSQGLDKAQEWPPDINYDKAR